MSGEFCCFVSLRFQIITFRTHYTQVKTRIPIPHEVQITDVISAARLITFVFKIIFTSRKSAVKVTFGKELHNCLGQIK
jgi:hypothetical protein